MEINAAAIDPGRPLRWFPPSVQAQRTKQGAAGNAVTTAYEVTGTRQRGTPFNREV